MPDQVHGVLVLAMSGNELSRVRTEFYGLRIFQSLRHIQYSRTASLRAMATLASRRSRHIARCRCRCCQFDVSLALNCCQCDEMVRNHSTKCPNKRKGLHR
jgi:hypothetical protein